MIVTEAELRTQLRRPQQGGRVTVPPGAVLSPAAQDFVGHWRLEVVEEPPSPSGILQPATSRTAPWDHKAHFTIDRDGATPTCTTCGSDVHHKPDRLTQLNACHFVPKDHPRIRLRGRLDSLQALVLLVAGRARAGGNGAVANLLDTLAAYVRELLAAEYQEREAAALELAGHDDAALRHATHDPRGALGVDHVVPSSHDPELLLWLNWLRSQVREVELVAIEAFPNPHAPAGQSVVHALNRLSSAMYWLELAITVDQVPSPSPS